MFFTAAFVAFLSATAIVAAAPGTTRKARRGIELASSKGASASSPGDSPLWFGVANEAPPGVKFKSISATLQVPSFKMGDQPQLGDTNGIAAWIGIDGLGSLSDDVLQGGIILAMNTWGAKLKVPDGKTFLVNAVEEWYPTPPYTLTVAEFKILFGHVLKMSIEATSETTGTFTIENLNTKQRLVRPLKAPAGTKSLQNTAEWIVESLIDGTTHKTMPAPDFGTLTFSDCVITATDGKTYGPDAGYLLNPAYKLETTSTKNSVSVRYVHDAELGNAPPPPPAGNGGLRGKGGKTTPHV